MNEHLKQRLVGAVVLVALVVIFVPMLLQGGKRTGIPMFGSNVPAKPEVKTDEINIPLQVPTPAPAASAKVVEQPTPPARPAPKPAPEPPVTAGKTPPKPAPAQPLRSAAPITTPPPAAAWAVQVGSFSEVDNAMKLRDTLRAKGYPAYVEEVKMARGTSYRVRVGPMLARGDAVALQGKLRSRLHLRGLVVHQP